MKPVCKHCEQPFITIASRRKNVEHWKDFCSEFCEFTALSSLRTFEIAEPCWSEYKTPADIQIAAFEQTVIRNWQPQVFVMLR
jgi:hypothetical protein